MYAFYSFSFRCVFSRLLRNVLIILVLLAGCLGTTVVHASGGSPHFYITPTSTSYPNAASSGYFTYAGRAGALIHDSVHITNIGTARGSVNLYAVDATTGQASGITFPDPADPRHNVGGWITLSSQKITLNPGQSRDVPFSLRVPSKVLPGQHCGGIIARDAIDQTKSSNTGSIHVTIHVQTQEILGVLINLPGTLVEKLNVTGITYNRESTSQRLLIGLANTGTQMLHPSGTLQVTDTKGRLQQNVPLKLATILPQTMINYPVVIEPNALRDGTYTANVSLKYEGDHTTKYTAHFMVPRFQPSTNQAHSKSAANPTVISHDIPLNPASFDGLVPWQYIGGILVIMILFLTPFLWRRKQPVFHKRFFNGKNAQKR